MGSKRFHAEVEASSPLRQAANKKRKTSHHNRPRGGSAAAAKDPYDFPSSDEEPVPEHLRRFKMAPRSFPPPPPKTIWEVVSQLDHVRAAFPAKPVGNADIDFLASLPAVNGALAAKIISKPKGSKRQKVEREFKMSGEGDRLLQRLEALLAQAAGIIPATPCENCAAGRGIFETCASAPTKPGLSRRPVFAGCPSCVYRGKGAQCRPSPSTPPRRVRQFVAMTPEFAELEGKVFTPEALRSAGSVRSFASIGGEDEDMGEDEDEVDVDEMMLIAEDPWGLGA